jgi:Flp pilus assembly protein TadD
MHIGVGPSYVEGHLAKVRAAAARYPDDAYAKRVLAEAEVTLGDGAKGEKLLAELLATAPGDSELLYLRGMRSLRAAREDEERASAHLRSARGWFAQSHKADENRFQTLIRYAESLSATERFTSENTLNIMLLANQLAPQVSEVAMNTATVLMAHKRYKEAENLLMPLASNAHDPGLAAAAQVMLAQVRGKNGAPDTQKPNAAAPAPAGE